MLTKQEMIERINALEEELFLSLYNQEYETDSEAYKEANRLKMLILKELELI